MILRWKICDFQYFKNVSYSKGQKRYVPQRRNAEDYLELDSLCHVKEGQGHVNLMTMRSMLRDHILLMRTSHLQNIFESFHVLCARLSLTNIHQASMCFYNTCNNLLRRKMFGLMLYLHPNEHCVKKWIPKDRIESLVFWSQAQQLTACIVFPVALYSVSTDTCLP